jgi:hypothetical protein
MDSLLRTMTEPPGGGQEKAISGLNGSSPVRSAEIVSDQSIQWIAGPVKMIGSDGTFYDDAIDGVITNPIERWNHGTPYAIISVLGSPSPGN